MEYRQSSRVIVARVNQAKRSQGEFDLSTKGARAAIAEVEISLGGKMGRICFRPDTWGIDLVDRFRDSIQQYSK